MVAPVLALLKRQIIGQLSKIIIASDQVRNIAASACQFVRSSSVCLPKGPIVPQKQEHYGKGYTISISTSEFG